MASATDETVQVKKYHPFAHSPLDFIRLLEIEMNSMEPNLVHL